MTQLSNLCILIITYLKEIAHELNYMREFLMDIYQKYIQSNVVMLFNLGVKCQFRWHSNIIN